MVKEEAIDVDAPTSNGNGRSLGNDRWPPKEWRLLSSEALSTLAQMDEAVDRNVAAPIQWGGGCGASCMEH